MARATGSIHYLEHVTPIKDESGKSIIHPMFVKNDTIDMEKMAQDLSWGWLDSCRRGGSVLYRHPAYQGVCEGVLAEKACLQSPVVGRKGSAQGGGRRVCRLYSAALPSIAGTFAEYSQQNSWVYSKDLVVVRSQPFWLYSGLPFSRTTMHVLLVRWFVCLCTITC